MIRYWIGKMSSGTGKCQWTGLPSGRRRRIANGTRKPCYRWRTARCRCEFRYVSISSSTVRCTTVQSAVLRLHVVRPSVRPSVTLVDQDHTGWKCWKLIARTTNTFATFTLRSPKATHLLPEEILRRLEVGWGKVATFGAQNRQYL